MKKFLTVLLVIAVMFTFSFGSAFAATATPGGSTSLDAQYAAKQAELTATKNAVIEKLASTYDEQVYGVGTITIPKAVYTQVVEKIYKEYMDVLQIAYSKGDLSKTAGKADGAARDNMSYADVDTVAEYLALATCSVADGKGYDEQLYYYDVLRLNFENYKNEVKTEINKVDTSLYTDDVMIKADPYQVTYKQYAEKVKADMLTAAEKITVASDESDLDTYKAYVNMFGVINGKLTKKTGYTDITTGKEIALTYKFTSETYTAAGTNKALKTKEELGITDSQEAATVATKKAQIAAQVAYYYNWYVTNVDSSTAAGKAQIAAAKELADAYAEVMNCRIENDPETVINTASPDGSINARENGFTWVQIKAKYDALADQATVLKAVVDATGKVVYDAAKIDKNLAKAKVEVYDGDADYSSVDALKANASAAAEDLDWAKQVKIAALEDARDTLLYRADGSEKYYAPEKEKVIAKYDEVIAKVNAATTVAQVDVISTTVDTSAIKDKSGVKTAIKGLSKFAEEKNKLDSYAAYVNGSTKNWEDGYKAPMTNDTLAAFYAKNGARTNAEIVALTAEAKAYFDTLPTNKEDKDAKKAVEELVAALPGYITIADKEAVAAAFAAYDEYDDDISNYSKLANAINQVRALDEKAMNDAIAALPKLANVTVANKEAVKALKEAMDAYESEYMYTGGNYNFAEYAKRDVVKLYVEAVRDAEKANVVATIAALPENATKAQIEAARAVYDAFVDEYQNALKNYDAKNMIVNLDKLTYAEAQLAVAEIKAVEGLKLKANSTATKGAITVKWTVTGDAAAADGFQVWKSTKMNSGFKKAFTTTKTSYKNTKGLKKGTRYYYKVRAYKVVDGKNVYSDWSNKAYRVAK